MYETAGVARAPSGGSAVTERGSHDAIVRAKGLTKRYGNQVAVDDVSFEVRRGEVFGFLGPNGSGKSTTIGMLLGLVEPSAGRIELFGLGPERRAEALARVGAIIETPAFYPYLSGFDNLSVMAALRGNISAARIREVLELVGLDQAAGKRFGRYSLGMKQRLGIAWTLIHDPELVVLDEPTNGLDPAGMLEVRHLILRLAEIGKTVFISTHLLNEVEQVCDRVAILQRGRVVASGRVAELVGGDTRYVVVADPVDRAAAVLRGVDGVEDVEVDADRVVVSTTLERGATLTAALVEAGIAVDEVRRQTSSLESVFLSLTGENGSVATNG